MRIILKSYLGRDEPKPYWKEVELEPGTRIEGLLKRIPGANTLAPCTLDKFGGRVNGQHVKKGELIDGQGYYISPVKINVETQSKVLKGITALPPKRDVNYNFLMFENFIER